MLHEVGVVKLQDGQIDGDDMEIEIHIQSETEAMLTCFRFPV